MSKLSETMDNFKIKPKKSKLKTTNSKSTVILKTGVVDNKKNEKIKKMRSTKFYIFI